MEDSPPMMSLPPGSSPLMDKVPPEVRLIVFRLALHKDSPLVLFDYDRWERGGEQHKR